MVMFASRTKVEHCGEGHGGYSVVRRGLHRNHLRLFAVRAPLQDCFRREFPCSASGEGREALDGAAACAVLEVNIEFAAIRTLASAQRTTKVVAFSKDRAA